VQAPFLAQGCTLVLLCRLRVQIHAQNVRRNRCPAAQIGITYALVFLASQ